MVRQARQRIFLQGDLPGFDVARQIELLLGLAESELGRFLLLYRGLNAEWTHRLVTHQPGSGALAPLERVFYERLPAVLATRERHGHFRRALQRHLRPGCVAASVPCGWMSELLALDYSACPGVQLVGIDYDPRPWTAQRAWQPGIRWPRRSPCIARTPGRWTRARATTC